MSGARVRPLIPAGPDWESALCVDGKGRVMGNLRNVAQALRTAPPLDGAVALNELSGSIMLRRPLPTIGRERPGNRQIEDSDASSLCEWLQHRGIPTSTKTVMEAIQFVAQENAFHPVRDYLASMRWDGKPRVGHWLSKYLGAADTEYTRLAGRLFLMSAVARIRRPGCKVDTMIVLEGDQGSGKSTACQILGGEWFTDHLPQDLSSKDASLALRGAWIVEIGEMASMSRTDANALKAWITRRTEKYRPPFGRYLVDEKRQSVLIGTINPNGSGYLRDPTGARRFWPVLVGKVNTKALERDRDQLWMEAVGKFENGDPWWPTDDEETRLFQPEQASRSAADPWEEEVLRYAQLRSETTLWPIARDCLNLELARFNRAEQNRIANILTGNGWKRGNLDKTTRRRVFTKPKGSAEGS